MWTFQYSRNLFHIFWQVMMQGTLAYNIIVGLIDYAQGNLLIGTCVKMFTILNPNISYKYTTFHTISHSTGLYANIWCCHYISHIINCLIVWRAMSDVIVIQVPFMPLILVYEERILHSWRNDCKNTVYNEKQS